MPQSVVSRQLANPFLAPDFSATSAHRVALAPPGQLGAARPAVQLVRVRRRRSLGVHGAARSRRPLTSAAWPGADATPGAAGRRGRAGHRTFLLADEPGLGKTAQALLAAQAANAYPLLAGRAERRQDQLGTRGRPVDARPPGHRDPRRRRHDRRLRRHRRRQLRGARPSRRLARRPRLPRHGRRRGALHQEQDVPALPARSAALRAHPGPHRAAAADGAHRHPADQRHRGLPGHLAVPRLDRRQQAAAPS